MNKTVEFNLVKSVKIAFKRKQDKLLKRTSKLQRHLR